VRHREGAHASGLVARLLAQAVVDVRERDPAERERLAQRQHRVGERERVGSVRARDHHGVARAHVVPTQGGAHGLTDARDFGRM
jgi:hypothetical protein